MFWNIRKKLMGKGGQEEYDTITEDNIKIKDPITTKNHIADYFEDLYQAREAESTHETWTKTINEKIKLITKTNTNETPNEITLEELNKNIKTLKRGKSTGPDNISNEAIIEANKTNITTINNILNNIYNTEKIPDQWQKGEIIIFYKGKINKATRSPEISREQVQKLTPQFLLYIYILDIDSHCPYLLSGETTFQLTSCSNSLHVYLRFGETTSPI